VTAVRSEGHTALLSSHVITDIEQACDRLVVLGRGQTLLDLSIEDAVLHHRVVVAADWDGSRPGAIASFPTMEGELLTLVRIGANGVVASESFGRPATLEEVVIGHLAAGRSRTSGVTEAVS
jgi:ABC-2 type transport system ATP-binding protein